MAVALIVAAGSGERLGADVPKALVRVAGRTLLQWSIDALASLPQIERTVVAMPPGLPAPEGVIGVDGGAVRSESVARALAASGEGDPVLVQDAARPLLTAELASAVMAALEEDDRADAAVAAAPLSDTVKQVQAGAHVVERTLDRRYLWAVQTPQVFRREALARALSVGADVLALATDDAWLVERTGGTVIVVPSSEENIKVTTPLDLAIAELLLAKRTGSAVAPDASEAFPA
jgi:2-C-methyl-D-erythritol 4-phosphate cytidylyltransferase